jgi:hypothetical protein
MDLERIVRYETDRAKDIRLGGTHGIDEVMKAERLRCSFRGQAAPASPRSRAIRPLVPSRWWPMRHAGVPGR